ncbi:MAG: hypothetical protein V3U75_09835 [Methylococcaceae bacterium]
MQKKFKILVAIIGLITASATSYAAPHQPGLDVTVEGTKVTVSWSPVIGSTSYTLYYAPYPALTPIGNTSVGGETEFSVVLPVGASYAVAVKANDGSGQSDFSNIEFFSVKAPDPADGQSETYSKTFSSLQGRYNYTPDDKKTVSFDFDTPFSSIQSASIEITAAGVNALLDSCVYPISGTLEPTFEIPTCWSFELAPRIFYKFQSLSGTHNGALAINTATSEFITTKEFLAETDFLVDGKGVLYITHETIDQQGGNLAFRPWFEVTGVTLTIVGKR